MVNCMRISTYDWHRQKGAVFEEYFDFEVPSHYGDFQQEYWLLRKQYALRDVSFFGKIKVTGRDRQRFLNGMLTSEIRALENGQGVWALFLDVKGHIHADLKVYAFADHLLLVLQPHLTASLMKGLDRYIMSEDVRMQDITPDFCMFQILGPQSENFLSGLGLALPSDHYHHHTISVASTPATLIRLPLGFALLSPATNGPAILDTLKAPVIGSRAFDAYRIENGLPLMHRDMDETNFPQEAGLTGALNFQKGCYLGQETMARIDAQGHVNRQIMGFVAEQPFLVGDKVFRDQKEVGRITSFTHSPLLNRPFGIGYIRREFAKDGESVAIGQHNITAIIRHLPLREANHA